MFLFLKFFDNYKLMTGNGKDHFSAKNPRNSPPEHDFPSYYKILKSNHKINLTCLRSNCLSHTQSHGLGRDRRNKYLPSPPGPSGKRVQ